MVEYAVLILQPECPYQFNKVFFCPYILYIWTTGSSEMIFPTSVFSKPMQFTFSILKTVVAMIKTKVLTHICSAHRTVKGSDSFCWPTAYAHDSNLDGIVRSKL